MARYLTDLSRVAISVAPSPATSGTSLGVTDANAAFLPDQYPWYAVLVPVSTSPTRANAEIVKVTGGSSSGGTTTYTIVRAQGSPVTTAQSVTTSFDIYNSVSAELNPTVSFVKNEVPSGTVNSSNTAFTTASNFVTGSLRVYQNGIRLKGGAVDFTEGTAPAFTFVTAPTTGDTLLVDYDINAGNFMVGSASWTSNETPSGTVNGSNLTFTLVSSPVTGTLALYRDGQLMTGGGADYSLSGSTITFTTAPATSSVLLAFYQSAVSTAGNADMTDGFHASDYGSAAGSLVTYYDGWRKVTGSWAYASASTITVPSGAASIYQKGDRIRLKQGAGYKYYVIVTVADTVLTVAVNTDYTVANSAITDMYFSHELNPLGYPDWFNATAPTVNVAHYDNGSGGQPTTNYCKIRVTGKVYQVKWISTGTKAGTFAYIATTANSFIVPANTTDGSNIGFADVNHNYANMQFDSGNLDLYTTVTIADNTSIPVLSVTLIYEI